MSAKHFAHPLSALLAISFIVQGVFFLAPQKASAQVGAINCIAGLLGIGGSGGAAAAGGAANAALAVPTSDLANLAQNTISASMNSITSGATTGSCVNSTILMPLARLMARIVLQRITASVVNFINGKGFSWPSFVQDLTTHMQLVGDSIAKSFVSQLTQAAFNSPFGPAIAFALMDDYQRQSSLKGFLHSYADSLFLYSPNQREFLRGDWSQGGAAAWFALTTQNNNNPFSVYFAAKNLSLKQMIQAKANRAQDLIQSSGFLSWCGGDTTSATTKDTVANWCSNCTGAGGTCDLVKNECIDSTGGRSASNQWGTANSSVGVSPQAPCTNPDGTPAKAQTPGSVIHDYAQKALVSTGMDQLVNANDLDSAIGAITSALIDNIIGGTGLFATSHSSGSRSMPFTTEMLATTTSAGSSVASVASLAETTISNIADYTSSWTSIKTVANTASVSVKTLADYCTVNAATAKTLASTDYAGKFNAVTILNNFVTTAGVQANAAQTTLTNTINPVFVQAQTAFDAASTTKALALKVQSDSSMAGGGNSEVSTNTISVNTLTDDTKLLTAAHPSAGEVASARQNAMVSGGAAANPVGSLTVHGGTLVDRLNLINVNAMALKASCDIPPDSVLNPTI